MSKKQYQPPIKTPNEGPKPQGKDIRFRTPPLPASPPPPQPSPKKEE